MNCVVFTGDITVIEGGTFYKPLQWSIGDAVASTPVNITGYSARMQIRSKITDTAALLSLPLATSAFAPDGISGIYLTDPPNGKFLIYIRDNDTLGICAMHKDITGVYDLFLTSPAGETVFRLSGVAHISAAVTRAS